MSALLANAEPRRIKASHRRRRKVASGQSVQRYYDPQCGCFLSVDPVTAYSSPIGAFNRYRYANNNPYRFTDPDGRQSAERQAEQYRKDAEARAKAASQKTKSNNDSTAKGTTSQSAYAHYKEGSGTPMRMSFSQIDTSSVKPSDFPKVDSAIDGKSNGAMKIDDKKAFTTSGDNFLMLGNITLRLQGTLNLTQDSYSFSGSLKSYDDRYDFNASTHRSFLGEALTRFGAAQEGKPFWIEIRGSKPIEESGSR